MRLNFWESIVVTRLTHVVLSVLFPVPGVVETLGKATGEGGSLIAYFGALHPRSLSNLVVGPQVVAAVDRLHDAKHPMCRMSEENLVSVSPCLSCVVRALEIDCTDAYFETGTGVLII